MYISGLRSNATAEAVRVLLDRAGVGNDALESVQLRPVPAGAGAYQAVVVLAKLEDAQALADGTLLRGPGNVPLTACSADAELGRGLDAQRRRLDRALQAFRGLAGTVVTPEVRNLLRLLQHLRGPWPSLPQPPEHANNRLSPAWLLWETVASMALRWTEEEELRLAQAGGVAAGGVKSLKRLTAHPHGESTVLLEAVLLAFELHHAPLPAPAAQGAVRAARLPLPPAKPALCQLDALLADPALLQHTRDVALHVMRLSVQPQWLRGGTKVEASKDYWLRLAAQEQAAMAACRLALLFPGTFALHQEDLALCLHAVASVWGGHARLVEEDAPLLRWAVSTSVHVLATLLRAMCDVPVAGGAAAAPLPPRWMPAALRSVQSLARPTLLSCTRLRDLRRSTLYEPPALPDAPEAEDPLQGTCAAELALPALLQLTRDAEHARAVAACQATMAALHEWASACAAEAPAAGPEEVHTVAGVRVALPGTRLAALAAAAADVLTAARAAVAAATPEALRDWDSGRIVALVRLQARVRVRRWASLHFVARSLPALQGFVQRRFQQRHAAGIQRMRVRMHVACPCAPSPDAMRARAQSDFAGAAAAADAPAAAVAAMCVSRPRGAACTHPWRPRAARPQSPSFTAARSLLPAPLRRSRAPPLAAARAGAAAFRCWR